MPIQIDWLQENRVLYERISGVVMADDLKVIPSALAPFLGNGSAPIHLLVDMRDVEEYPRNVRQLKDAMDNMNRSEIGWTLLITSDKVVRFLSSVTTQILVPHARMKVFDTPDDALRFLSEQDTTLAPFPQLAGHTLGT